MSNPMDQNLREKFSRVLGAVPEVRSAALDRESAGDAALRQRLEAMVAGAEARGRFLAERDHGSAGSTPAEGALREGPGTLIGPYRLLEQIGQGGFGVVFKAEQRSPITRTVALKIIKLGMDTKAVIARFEVERQALAMMDHPNIARVLDAGATETGRPYFVMELVRGDPITEYCDRNNLSTRDRLDLFALVCHAVQHAHQKGIIHRDIKPGNVLVTVADGRPVPKVIDFGIAKATLQRLTEKTLFTEHRALIGTPAYMSPEQAEMTGVDIDTRSDIYSLGVLLYELLTGTTPFDTRSLMEAGYAEIQRIIREVEPPKPSTRISTLKETLPGVAAHRRTDPGRLSALVRGDLDWIVMMALEKDRVRRYETASGLAMDVQRHLDGEPVNAAPPSRSYRVRKFLRRNRAAALVGCVVVGALIVGLAGVGAGLVRAERALRREAVQRDAAEVNAKDAAVKAARAMRLSEFLQSTFGSLDPNQPIGREVSLRTILDAASKRLDSGQLREEPEVEADVRFMLGNLYYMSLNDWYSAEREYADAAKTRERVLGPSHRQTLSATHNLGIVLHYQGRYPEAEELARRTLERRAKAFGDEDPDTMTSMDKLSWALSAMNRFEEAEPLRVRGLELRRRVFGEDAAATITSINYLGNLYLEQGRLAEAEAQYREQLERTQRVYGATSNQAAGVMGAELSDCLIMRGKFDEAVSLRQESLLIRRTVYGDRHRVVARALSKLGAACTKAGRYPEAERALTEALDIHREVAPGEDALAWTLFDLGMLRASQDRLSDAEAFMREGLAIRGKLAAANGRSNDPWSLRALASVLGAQGRQREANELVREAVSIESKKPAGK